MSEERAEAGRERVGCRFVVVWFVFVALSMVLIYPFCIGPYSLEVTRHEREMNAPGELRIAHLSDLHLKQIGLRERWVTRAVAGFNPDFIVITGDSVTDKKYLPLLASFLPMLPADVPVFGVYGNWERAANISPKQLRELFASTDGRFLVNETGSLEVRGLRVGVTGLDDPWGGTDRSTAYEDARAFPVKLLAMHRPFLREEMPPELTRQFDLALAGHTHGGQIQFWGFAPVRSYGSADYVEGWYEQRDPPLYVSRGIGTSVLPVRTGSRPEVALIRLVGPDPGVESR